MTQIVNATNDTLHSDTKRSPQSPRYIDGLGDVADQYDGFILDIYGVIHNGVQLFPGTIKCLQQLKNHNKRVVLLSNTPRRGFESAEDLFKMGVTDDLYTGIITAGDSAHDKLKEFKGQKCWFAGTEFFEALLEGIDLIKQDTPDDADFILNAITGLYEWPTDEIHHALQQAQKRNLPMICSNPDLVVNIGEEQHICAGTYALYYEEIGGYVSYHGKPHVPVYKQAQDILQVDDKSKILAVGDALHTDIQGANNFGIDSVFNLVGIHWEEVQLDHAPGKADIEKIKTVVENQPHRPTYALGGFEW